MTSMKFVQFPIFIRPFSNYPPLPHLLPPTQNDEAEASLSTLSWLYILVCAIVQKYHEIFS